MRHAFQVRRRSLLASLRSPYVGWLQIITALLWILLPAPVVNSYWHDYDYDGTPEFYSDPPSPWETEDADSDGLTNAEESTFGSSPFLPDSDYDGLSDVQEYTISQALGSNLNPWDQDTDDDGLNDNVDNDPLIPLDTDGDGMPDNVDPYPNDPTNDTSWWNGGQFWIDAIFATIGGTSYSTSAGPQDSDGDGIIDVADPYTYDYYNNTTWWSGGTFRINGVEQTFANMPFTISSGTGDADYDGIPDGLDLFPTDNNNNSLLWNGGSYIIDGNTQYWNGGWTAAGDTDGDGIPDALDPYPYDSANNSVWYDIIQYWADGSYNFMSSGWHSASSGNADGDSLPDVLDPYPNDPTNNTSWWYGGTFWIDGAQTMITVTDPFAWATTDGMFDADGDGIYDSVDPYLNNAANNTAFWQGGTFWIDGSQQSFGASELGYNAAAGLQDTDSDGIPDNVDPYVSDGSNNTGYWAGGAWWVYGALTTFDEMRFNYMLNPAGGEDLDGDGIPNIFDPYPEDSSNYTITFSGGSYMVSGVMTELTAGHMAGVYADDDGDGIPDYFDPYMGDAANNSSYWSGGPWLVDGNNQDFSGRYYATSAYADADNDGLLDLWDPYINDSSNNTSFWSGSFYSDGVEVNYSQNPYATSGGTLDSDGDGIPNGMDPYPYDNNNNTAYWGGGTWWINGQEHTWATSTPYAANANAGDTDGDGIINVLDPYPNDSENNTSTFTGGSFRINGILNDFGHYFYSADIDDTDGDGIPDFLDPYINDLTNNTSAWAGDYFYIDGSPTFLSGYRATIGDYDADDDGIPDVHDPLPLDATNGTSWWSGGNYWVNGLLTPFSPYAYATSEGYDDTDEDEIPDAMDPYGEDFTNNTSYWYGGDYWIDALLEEFEGKHYATDGIWDDSDFDGLPDHLDPYPLDFDNNTQWWSGSFYVDGVYNWYHEALLGTATIVDTDEDGIPDQFDLYVVDDTNNTSWWTGGYHLVDGEQLWLADRAYATNVALVDTDADLLPDLVDPYPRDAGNNFEAWRAWVLTTNPFDGIDPGEEFVTVEDWMDAWFDQEDEDRNVQPLYLTLTSLDDTDSDGIPDMMEEYFGLDPEDPEDAAEDRYYTGWTHLEQYLAGQDLNDPNDAPQQWVSDGIDNVYKVRYEFDLMDPTVATSDPDDDGMITLIEYYLGTDPREADEDTDEDGASDRWEEVAGTDPDDAGNSPSMTIQEGQDAASAYDADGDGYSGQVERMYGSDPDSSGSTPETHPSFKPSQLEASYGGASDSAFAQAYETPSPPDDDGVEWHVFHLEGTSEDEEHTFEFDILQAPELASIGSIPAMSALPRGPWGTFSNFGNEENPNYVVGTAVAGSEDREYMKCNRWEISTNRVRLTASVPKVVSTSERFLVATLSWPLTEIWSGGYGHNPQNLNVQKLEVKELVIPPNQTVSNEIEPTIAGVATQDRLVEVRFIPVDLDIEHPATGECSEDRQHDPTKGGYVAVRRDDETPVTNLVLRLNDGIPNMKYRLKFSGGEKFKVWKDAARTQVVVSEQTEFVPSQGTELFLEGLKKSDSVGAESITLEAVRAGGSLAVETVYFTVVEAEFDVWLNIFIPPQWGDFPSAHPINYDIIQVGNNFVPEFRRKIFAGDDRSFTDLFLDNPTSDVNDSLKGTSSRAHSQVVIIPFRDLDLNGIKYGTDKSAIGASHNYLKSASVPDPNAGYSSSNRLLPQPVVTQSGTAPTTGMKIDGAKRYGPDKNGVKFKFHGSADNPIVTPSASIDWDFEIAITVNSTNLLAPKWGLIGHKQDGFPAYEIYVKDSDGNAGNDKGTTIYQYDPIPLGRTPNDLFPDPIGADELVSGAIGAIP